MKKGLFWLLLMALPCKAFAGKISELFDNGAFGVDWGATIEEVRSVHPDGTEKEYVGIQNYIVQHSKPVLKINRQNAEIRFTFNSLGQLHAIGVDFTGSDFVEVYSTLKTYFGENEVLTDSPRISWPRDGDIKMYLISIPDGFSIKPVLTIENVKPSSEASKDDLGFN